jgi:hypothetical protein
MSAHEYGYAFDVVTSPMDALNDMGAYWTEQGGVWGGAKDPIHFEFPGFTPPAQTWEQRAGTSWWENLVAGFPIAFWPSVVLDMLGIPASAVKDITPAQEQTLRKIALGL